MYVCVFLLLRESLQCGLATSYTYIRLRMLSEGLDTFVDPTIYINRDRENEHLTFRRR